jgi:CheY-like chemotaxis protein
VLERLGYQVAGFTEATAAIAAFRAAPESFDAVITDLSMPGMSGNDVAKEVFAIRPDIPVVMTSGYVRAEDRTLALASGVRELVMKPNTVEALGQILHRLLEEEDCKVAEVEAAPTPNPPPLRGGGGS